LVDLNDDGHDDVISGSYWPGHIFVFEGRGNGEFAKMYELEDCKGEKLHAGPPWKSKSEPQMDSLAAAPHMVDFDADGDLDLLVGNISGRVILIRNDGTRKSPKFVTERRAILGGKTPIKVPGGDAGPTTADWDGDGLFDLIVGAGDGSVWLYRNTGTAKRPAFAAGRQLIAKNPRGYQPLAYGETPKHSGGRAKVCVVDYDGDGLLDLLVGGYASIVHPDPELTAEQIAERDRLRAEQKELGQKLSAIYTQYRNDPEKRKEAMQPLNKKRMAVYQKLRKLEPRRESTGWVWLYRQKPKMESF